MFVSELPVKKAVVFGITFGSNTNHSNHKRRFQKVSTLSLYLNNYHHRTHSFNILSSSLVLFSILLVWK